MEVIKWLKTDAYRQRCLFEDRKLFTQLEFTTRGLDDAEYAENYMAYVQMYMGEEAFARWLATLTPPLEERTDQEIRAALFAKLQEVMK